MDAIDARPLPPHPSLEQYKKQAKDLVKACRAGDPEAIRRVDRARTGPGATAATTPGTATPGTATPGTATSGTTTPSTTTPSTTTSGTTTSGSGDSACTLTDAQHAIAREYGFTSWPRFSTHLRGLEQGSAGQYEAAVDAIVSGDLPTLTALLRRHPGLVRERSNRVHGATLLHYVAANGVENYRQKTPGNALEIADLLLRRGSEPDATAFMYGGDATTMGLLVSSVHPADAGLQAALAEKLIDFGAAPNGPLDDCEPLLTALIFGYLPAAEALVRRGARVDNVVTAAGLGREDLVRRYVDDHGELRPDAQVARSHARWMPSPRANVEWALVLAAWLGRDGIVDYLSARVDLGARGPHGFTALHWAAMQARLPLVDLLLERGAPLEARDKNHDSTVLEATVWVAVNDADDTVLPVIERLLAAGARTDRLEIPTGNDEVDALLRRHDAGTGRDTAG